MDRQQQKRRRAGRGRGVVAAALVCAAVAAAWASGCVRYATFPTTGSSPVLDDPNAPWVEEVMTEALRWTVEKYPPGHGVGEGGEGEFAINLPKGMKPAVYERIASKVSARARAVSEATAGLPVYHVARVRVRGPEARVDVLRPALELGPGPDGMPVYQGVEVFLEGRWGPWRVTGRRVWAPGSIEVPALNYAHGGTGEPSGATAGAGDAGGTEE